jgi:hypothetical protein
MKSMVKILDRFVNNGLLGNFDLLANLHWGMLDEILFGFFQQSRNVLPKHKLLHSTPEIGFWFHHAVSHTYSSKYSLDTSVTIDTA